MVSRGVLPRLHASIGRFLSVWTALIRVEGREDRRHIHISYCPIAAGMIPPTPNAPAGFLPSAAPLHCLWAAAEPRGP